ncbi:dTDP-4-dehydrorhamnose reductase [Roseobacter sp. N2S]|nr:dTDP-4-dehydrorhamnose reductase [Roseobacter sp. N2S]
MNIIIFGQTGQVALELQRIAALQNVTLTALPRAVADLGDPDACATLIASTDADIIINAAAYTAVDQAETDETTATCVNATAPGAMARAAAARGIPFLHVSTDYVFDGSGATPWAEDAPTAPLGAYGRSKLAGEAQITAAGGPHAILRTAWVFSAHGNNFVKTMLRLAQTRDGISVVADQFGGPTSARAIAQALLTLATAFHRGQGTSGIFHFAGAPTVSWAEFATRIFSLADIVRKPTITPIPSSQYPTPAARPMNSSLNCHKIKRVYGIEQPDWVTELTDVLAELDQKS